MPHNLIQEYHQLPRIPEEAGTPRNPSQATENDSGNSAGRVKRTPKTLYRVPDEETALLAGAEGPSSQEIGIPGDEAIDSSSPVVSLAITINFVANAILLAGKIAVMILTSSLSVLASLVDAALDFLSTLIVFTTTQMIMHRNRDEYPIGRSRLEPVGVLVFSVVMITAFAQVALECIQRLSGMNHSIVQLGAPAIGIMVGTVVIKGMCWFWCRLINNSSVQALAQDAMTDGTSTIGPQIQSKTKLCSRFQRIQYHLSYRSVTQVQTAAFSFLALIIQLNSWLLRQTLVARCTWRLTTIPIRHDQLVEDLRISYS